MESGYRLAIVLDAGLRRPDDAPFSACSSLLVGAAAHPHHHGPNRDVAGESTALPTMAPAHSVLARCPIPSGGAALCLPTEGRTEVSARATRGRRSARHPRVARHLVPAAAVTGVRRARHVDRCNVAVLAHVSGPRGSRRCRARRRSPGRALHSMSPWDRKAYSSSTRPPDPRTRALPRARRTADRRHHLSGAASRSSSTSMRT